MAVRDEVLARLLKDFPDFVVVLDAAGNVLWANARAEQQTGRTLEEFAGRSGLELVHPDDLELVLRSLDSVQGKSVGTAIEVRLQTPTGWRLVELIGTPVGWFGSGAVLFCLRDLTERRRFEVARDEVAMFRTLVQNAATVTMLVSTSGRVMSASGALTRMLGHDPEMVENGLLTDIVAEADRVVLAHAMEEALRGATARHPTLVQVSLLRHATTESVPFELTLVNLVDDPTVGGLVVTAHDVSQRVAAELELRSTLSLLKATLDSTADGILVVDVAGDITSFNGRFAEMWRLPNELLHTGRDAAALQFVLDQLVEPDDFLSKVAELYARPDSESTDTLTFKDGRVFERYSKPQLVEGEVVGRVWCFRDSTERSRLEAELSHQAFHDVLTGLANKALFQDRLNQAVARTERSGKDIAVLFLDLDNFKTVNDSLGHSTGDDLLRMVAGVLAGCLRGSDTVARLGGDEFAILIEDIERHSETIQVADRILEALRQPITLGTKDVVATASIGIAFGIGKSTGDELLRDADLAMYTAKERGKNRYEEFQHQMHTRVVERLELEADLRQALVNGELVVHYQPVRNLRSRVIVGFEALVRWQHPMRGLLLPEEFVAFAEQIGLVGEIDTFVLTEASGQVMRWKAQELVDPSVNISINLSARDIADGVVEIAVGHLLRTSALDPASLILEITESAMVHDTESAARRLYALKALGLRISIDDFGTGYSSLAYLQQLPIDILKIDSSFVASLSRTDGPVGLAGAIIQIADTLGHATVAEGIENEVQLNRLLQLGCQLGQGFHLGAPLNAAATEALLHARAANAWVTTEG